MTVILTVEDTVTAAFLHVLHVKLGGRQGTACTSLVCMVSDQQGSLKGRRTLGSASSAAPLCDARRF